MEYFICYTLFSHSGSKSFASVANIFKRKKMLHKATEKKNVLTIRVVVIKWLLYEAKWLP